MSLANLLPKDVTGKAAAAELGIHPDHMYRILRQDTEASWWLAKAISEKFPKIKLWMVAPSVYPPPKGRGNGKG
jgi:hypothetical protein